MCEPPEQYHPSLQLPLVSLIPSSEKKNMVPLVYYATHMFEPYIGKILPVGNTSSLEHHPIH
jgi:hypothetical protein